MTACKTFKKARGDVLPVSIDWTDLETSLVEQFQVSQWTVPRGLRVNSVFYSDGIATAVISGGEPGASYEMENRVIGQSYSDSRRVTVDITGDLAND